MTSIEHSYHQQGHVTVVTVDFEEQTANITNSNYASYWTVYKTRDQTAFFKIRVSKGDTPHALEGHFSSLQKAIDFVVDYLKNSKEQQSIKNVRMSQDRKERNAAKANSEGS